MDGGVEKLDRETGTRLIFPQYSTKQNFPAIQNKVRCFENYLLERDFVRGGLWILTASRSKTNEDREDLERVIIILLIETHRKWQLPLNRDSWDALCGIEKDPIRLLTSFYLSASQMLKEQIGMPNYWNMVSNCVCKCHFKKKTQKTYF